MEKTTRQEAIRLSFRRGDLAAAALVLAAAAALALAFLLPHGGREQVTVEIRRDGVLVESFPLSQDRRITVEGDYTNVIVAEDGAVWVESSTCPGEDCVHSGKVTRPGRSVVCLPNRVEIRLVGGNAQEDDVDMVAG